MNVEIYTQRFQDFGEELQGTIRLGQPVSIHPAIAKDLESIELRSTTTDHVWRWDFEGEDGQSADRVFKRIS